MFEQFHLLLVKFALLVLLLRQVDLNLLELNLTFLNVFVYNKLVVTKLVILSNTDESQFGFQWMGKNLEDSLIVNDTRKFSLKQRLVALIRVLELADCGLHFIWSNLNEPEVKVLGND